MQSCSHLLEISCLVGGTSGPASAASVVAVVAVVAAVAVVAVSQGNTMRAYFLGKYVSKQVQAGQSGCSSIPGSRNEGPN